MAEENQRILAQSQTAEAAHAAAIAEEARQNAFAANLAHLVSKGVREAFAADVEEGRYVDISRVPLLCQSVIGIDKKLDEMKKDMVTQDQFWPIKTLVYGFVGITLCAVIGALLILVIKQ